MPSGLPWHIDFLRLATLPNFSAFRDLLYAEGLLNAAVVDSAKKLLTKSNITNLTKGVRLTYLEQPFLLNLGRERQRITILTPRRIGNLFLPTHVLGKGVFYSGQAVVRFEHSPFPEDADKRVAVLRVLKFLGKPSDSQSSSGSSQANNKIPKDGTLLTIVSTRNGLRRRTSTPFSIDVETMTDWYDLGLLMGKGNIPSPNS